MSNHTKTLSLCALLALTCSLSAQAEEAKQQAGQEAQQSIGPKHGATLIPKARQVICENDGGYNYPDDGSKIPNAACRAAFLFKQDSIPIWERRQMFTEWPAYSQNLEGTSSPADKVPDGHLCSAGIAKFEGIDQPHKDWQVSSVTVKDGKATLYYDATKIHEPSKWDIYIAKKEFDPTTQKLSWDALEPLKVTEVIVPPGTDGGVYQIEVEIPQDRVNSQHTLLYVQWERIDPARETFFSCSDVSFTATPTKAKLTNG
ncbi:lytic polysaccharide monooxygenase auxiliary activity family 9 protein [Serratia rubidaea]|uniref:lytic polysaccharide monooxygenase auxiliary activity family 9 protein n=1 Tax=Serratia rubidaea TaxID=61652 RepID=UPI00078B02D8|nr:lytic polysaccharide monooxygenase auxiliary activity family 9 protein [Serratia rubidaea]AML58551.1 Spindolin-related protein [Serratia rubidaea]MDC6110810.1 lytic polysaccharide monooxygenase [Serratia rubidaea]UJD80379.1 chitin-binding protein [Serratia rubidaea]UJD84935.1 chitin-binding protein [Serratia rubidaea]WBF47588.1 lytic polysaccharide monooxygenase [Serratia rubidaea]